LVAQHAHCLTQYFGLNKVKVGQRRADLLGLRHVNRFRKQDVNGLTHQVGQTLSHLAGTQRHIAILGEGMMPFLRDRLAPIP
jgi:hypothetical protein